MTAASARPAALLTALYAAIDASPLPSRPGRAPTQSAMVLRHGELLGIVRAIHAVGGTIPDPDRWELFFAEPVVDPPVG